MKTRLIGLQPASRDELNGVRNAVFCRGLGRCVSCVERAAIIRLFSIIHPVDVETRYD